MPDSILHVLDWQSLGPPAAWTIAHLAAHHIGAPRHAVVVLGGSDDARRASPWLGIHASQNASANQTAFSRSSHTLKRIVSNHNPDVIVGWGARAASAAHAAAKPAHAKAIAFRTAAQCPPAPAPNHHAISDGTLHENRARAKQRLLGEHADAFVITCVGLPTTAEGARRTSHAAGVLAVGHHRTVALIDPNQADRAQAERFSINHNSVWPVITADMRSPNAFLAADVVLYALGRAHVHQLTMLHRLGNRGDIRPLLPLPDPAMLLWAASLGLPIAADDTPEIRALSAHIPIAFVPPGDRLAMNRHVFSAMSPRQPNLISSESRATLAQQCQHAFLRALDRQPDQQAHAAATL